MTLLITYLLNIIDYLFTAHWVRSYGLEIEANPIGRWMLETVPRQVVFKLILPAIGLLILCWFRDHKLAGILKWVVFGIYAVIVVYHICIWISVKDIN